MTRKLLKKAFLEDSKLSVLDGTDKYFIPILMETDYHPFEWLIAGLKTTADNLGILHRNLVDDDFFSDHEIFEGYYKKLYEMLDDVTEIIIGLGGRELSIYEASQICPSLIVDGFKSETAYILARKMFRMLIQGFEGCEEVVPNDVYSKFEEYIYWLRKECMYKIGNYFKEK